MPLIISPRQLTQRAHFYQQLSQLTAAGIPIIGALEMLARNPPHYSYREPVTQLVGLLKSGSPVAEGMRQLGTWVPKYDIALISAGEQSGRIDTIFRLLASNYEERAALLRQTISDLSYPVFMLHFTVLIFVFIDWVRSSMSIEMLVLKFLLYISPIYIAAALLIFALQGKRGQYWRAFFEKLLRPIPLVGSALQAVALSRLIAALEALLNAGVLVIEAWEMAAAASGSPAIQKAVMAWKPQVVGGSRLSEVINAEPAQFPEVFRNLYNSGEISGGLDETLLRLHEYYKDEATRKMRFLSKTLTKTFYMGVLLYIAYRILSFYIDYFHNIKELTG